MSIDFSSMFITIFVTIYTWCIKFNKLFFKPSIQLFSYDKQTNKIYITGYVGNKLVKMSMNFFILPGTYLIKANNITMGCFIDGVLDGSDPSVTYVLGTDFIQLQNDTQFVVTDKITDEISTKTIKRGEVVDFKKLIADMFFDE